ncbi:MAG: CRTAC1 family protein [Salinibacter sp.]|uniref:CRTAC1 family protein n=1 Tax=Salinibacter sp. TaxID=2065818 RepID=UPI0035D42C9D
MTNQTLIRGLLSVVFVGLLAAPLVITQWSGEASGGPMDREKALERHGFVLENVAQEVGIDFTHHAPNLDSSLSHIMPEVAQIGASVSVADYDGDGYSDLYVTNSKYGTENALYRNQGDGTFTNVAPELGLANVNQRGTGTSMGSVWGDYDNDGDEDLFLYKWGQCMLFRNEDGTGFTQVTDHLKGLPDWMNAGTAIWLDANQDGFLDLLVGGFYPATFDLWNLETTRVMPESYEYARNGGQNYLFLNQGDGTFTEVSEEWGLTGTRWTLAAVASDFNRSGYPDLFIANDFGADQFFVNVKGQRFRAASRASNVGRIPKSGMNASTGDVMNRGTQALYVSNLTEEGVLVQGNNLWMAGSTASGETPTFDNLAGTMGVARAGWSYGAQFGDLNNDGWQDLFVVNGFYSGSKSASYWYDFSKVAGGNEDIIANAANWPAMEGRSLSGHQQTRIWINDGAGQFQNVAPAVGGASTHDGRAVALVDLQNRGVLDAVVANQRGPVEVYRNKVDPQHSWIAFELTGTESNRSAIGTRVTLHWNDQQQVQQVHGGSGFASQNQRRIHFGLGSNPTVEKAVIRWPSGTTQTIESPEMNTIHDVTEP